MTQVDFVLSIFLVSSIFMNILQLLDFKYKYKRMENVYLKKEKRLLEKEVEQQKEIIALENRVKVKVFK